MKKRTKQYIFGIAAIIFFLPPIYFLGNDQTKDNWKVICLSFLPLIIILGVLRFYLGPDAFGKVEGYEEFTSTYDYLKRGQDFYAKFFRFIFKYILPVLILFALVTMMI